MPTIMIAACIMTWAMAETAPLSSITLPNRNDGKNCAKKTRGAPQVGLPPADEQWLRGQSGGPDRGSESEQKHARAPIRQPDQ
jgi:hypothetical protein